jgi:Dienelactone hydrolase family
VPDEPPQLAVLGRGRLPSCDFEVVEVPRQLVGVPAPLGVMVAQQLAQTRPHARGWPEDVPVQVHGKEADPFFAEDLEAARALVESTDRAELFLYPGNEHLFADASLPAYDATAAALLTERVLAFLDASRVPASWTSSGSSRATAA